MQLASSFAALAVVLLALTAAPGEVEARNQAKVDAKLAKFKTVTNLPTSPDAYFNIMGRDGKYCLRAKHHHISGHYTLRTTRKCSPMLTSSPTSGRSFFRVPTTSTEASHDYYLGTVIKGKVQCLRMWRHAGSIHRNPAFPVGHRFLFDDCSDDISYVMREKGNEGTEKHLLQFVQLGTGKRQRCLRVSPLGGLRIRRCSPSHKGQQLTFVYPSRSKVTTKVKVVKVTAAGVEAGPAKQEKQVEQVKKTEVMEEEDDDDEDEEDETEEDETKGDETEEEDDE